MVKLTQTILRQQDTNSLIVFDHFVATTFAKTSILDLWQGTNTPLSRPK